MEAGEQAPLQLQLSLDSVAFITREVRVQLTVTNAGDDRIVIPRVPETLIKLYVGWGGWQLNIKNHDKQLWGPWVARPPHFRKRDLITLEPGAQFSVTINMADVMNMKEAARFMHQKGEEPPHELVDTAGEYDVQVRLRLGSPDIPFLLFFLSDRIWTGDVRSNTIRVVVHPPGTYLPKRIDFPSGREEGWVCQCRADCNPELPENPCLQRPLEEQSQIAIGVDRTRASAIETTGGLARAKLGGNSLPPFCFCTKPGGKRRGAD
jgi:hypothetical protein